MVGVAIAQNAGPYRCWKNPSPKGKRVRSLRYLK
jgi:hypothetical protein